MGLDPSILGLSDLSSEERKENTTKTTSSNKLVADRAAQVSSNKVVPVDDIDEGYDVPDDEPFESTEEDYSYYKEAEERRRSESPRRPASPSYKNPIQFIKPICLTGIYVHVVGEEPHLQLWDDNGTYIHTIRDKDVIDAWLEE